MTELTAGEISNLLVTYLNNTMASVVTASFKKNAEDPEVREMLEFALQIADEEVRGAERFLKGDNRVLPEPFTDSDVDTEVKYFSDNYVILIKAKLAQDAIPIYGLSLTSAIQPEIRDFYITCLHHTAELLDRCLTLSIKQGLHQPTIHIPRNSVTEKIHEQAFLGRIFGKNRSLSAPEVLQLVTTYQSAEVIREMLRTFTGTDSPELKKHFERGQKLFADHLETIQSKLERDELPQLPTWESEINVGRSAPFSERLMLFKSSILLSSSASIYGASSSATLRRDLGLTFMTMMGEVLIYAEDTGNLLIKYLMLDQPPLVSEPIS